MSSVLCCCVRRGNQTDDSEMAYHSSAYNVEEILRLGLDAECGHILGDCLEDEDEDEDELVNDNNREKVQAIAHCIFCRNKNAPIGVRLSTFESMQVQMANLAKCVLTKLNLWRRRFDIEEPLVLDEHLQEVARKQWYSQAQDEVRFRHFPSNQVSCNCALAVHGCLAFRSEPKTICLSAEDRSNLVERMARYWVSGPKTYYPQLFRALLEERTSLSDNIEHREYLKCGKLFPHMINRSDIVKCGLHIDVVRGENRDLVPKMGLWNWPPSHYMDKPRYLICAVLVLERNAGNPASPRS